MTLPDDAAARKAASNEMRKERDRIRYKTDPEWAEKKRRQARDWGRKNTERNRARAREWAAANPEAVAKRRVDWYCKNKKIQRKSTIKRKYGLTPEQYEAMRIAQKDLCAICREPDTYSSTSGLCVDHCHVTGRVRGLLCNRCNRAIGLMRDDERVLQAAAGYIRHHDMVIANASH
jgi:hypothetical protein